MPLTISELEDLRAECFADDLDIPPAAMQWGEERARNYFESAGESEKGPQPCMYEVIGKMVNVRATTSTSAEKLGQKLKGDLIAVDGRMSGWVRLVEKFGPVETQVGWLLIDGTELGVGMLLRHASGPMAPRLDEPGASASGSGAAKPAWEAEPFVSTGGVNKLVTPMSYEVVHGFVKARAAACARAP